MKVVTQSGLKTRNFEARAGKSREYTGSNRHRQ
jgi:hypothetical protein